MNCKVSTTEQLRTAFEAGYTVEQIEIAQPDASAHAAAIAAARAEGQTAGVEEGKKAGATAERARLAALQEIVCAGFEAEHSKAIADGTSAADFALIQTKAAKDRGITLSAIKKDSTSADHASPPNDPTKKAAITAGWDKASKKVAAMQPGTK